MQRLTARTGMMPKLGLGAVALASLAAPLASAFATAEDPTAHHELTAEQVEKARQLFNDGGCGSCHTLADAGGSGMIGPAFDGNANLDKAFAVDRITNGQGAMPSFGWMAAEDIDLLADYIVHAKK